MTKHLLLQFCFPLFVFQFSISEEFYKICDIPEIYVCDRFLSNEECDYLIKFSKGSLIRSTVIDDKSPNGSIDPRRNSFGMFVPSPNQDNIIKGIETRIAEATKIPQSNGESLYILKYEVGGEYQPHYDYFDPKTSSGLLHYNRGGQRIISFLMYLNTPEEGGETIFPRLGIRIPPEKGMAVFFYNVNQEGKPEPLSLHGGSPVIKGEKWLMTKWIRERTFR